MIITNKNQLFKLLDMENDNKESNVKSTLEAATALVKAVPIYDDALQPVAKEIGKSLATVGKVVNIALLPLSGIIWGFEKVGTWLNPKLAEKLENVSEEDIVTPNPQVAGSAIEALRFVAEDEELRELYANLLASSMNKNTRSHAHPGYVDIIKNMTSDEAMLLKAFIKIKIHPLIDIKGKSKILAEGSIDIFRSFSHLDKEQTLTSPELSLAI